MAERDQCGSDQGKVTLALRTGPKLEIVTPLCRCEVAPVRPEGLLNCLNVDVCRILKAGTSPPPRLPRSLFKPPPPLLYARFCQEVRQVFRVAARG